MALGSTRFAGEMSTRNFPRAKSGGGGAVREADVNAICEPIVLMWESR
jgi:hypothetical protein